MFESLNNNVATVKEGINTRDFDFVPLKTFEGQLVVVDGFFFTKGDYGKQVVVVGNGHNINMPKRAVEQFEKIASDGAMVEAVLSGHLALKDIKEIKTKNGKTAIYTLADI